MIPHLGDFRKKTIMIFCEDRSREGDWEKFGMGENQGRSF
jgi:hypothetical protein